MSARPLLTPPSWPEIEAQARAIGFEEIRATRAYLPEQIGQDLDDYVAAGCHGTMTWMAETAERRRSPLALWPQAASVLCLGLNYAPARDPLAVLAQPKHGAISVYAQHRDYHDLLKKMLKQMARWLVEKTGAEVKVFVDTAPVMEKPLAAQAGLGWVGKHTNIVSRRFGSWLFLGEIFTTLALEDAPPPPAAGSCGSCQRCQTRCPTGALSLTAEGAPRIDPRRCIAYLTIEHHGDIPEDLRPLLGNRIYGCDDCMAVCPWNRFAPPTPHRDFWPRVELMAPELRDLVTLTDAEFRDVFTASPIKRIGRERFLRNVLIALGNSGDSSACEKIALLQTDPSPLLQTAAAWALARLSHLGEENPR